jgi:hypothetical protein
VPHRGWKLSVFYSPGTWRDDHAKTKNNDHFHWSLHSNACPVIQSPALPPRSRQGKRSTNRLWIFKQLRLRNNILILSGRKVVRKKEFDIYVDRAPSRMLCRGEREKRPNQTIRACMCILDIHDRWDSCTCPAHFNYVDHPVKYCRHVPFYYFRNEQLRVCFQTEWNTILITSLITERAYQRTKAGFGCASSILFYYFAAKV